MVTIEERVAKTEVSDQPADWDAVYREQLPRIYNYFRYRVGDTPLAEDLTSATFEKAWRSRAQYRADLAAFSTWLITIARNTATDHFRRPRPEVSMDELEQLPGAGRVDEVVARRERNRRLGELLATLPKREREVIALKYGAELTHREIAQQLGLTTVHIGVIVYRTVRRLRKAWEIQS